MREQVVMCSITKMGAKWSTTSSITTADRVSPTWRSTQKFPTRILQT